MAEGVVPLTQIALGLVALFGHFALWTGVFSRVHAVGLRRWLLHVVEKPIFLVLLGVPGAVVGASLWPKAIPWWPSARPLEHELLRGYFWLCLGIAAYTVFAWSRRTWRGQPAQLLQNESEVLDIAQETGRPLCGNLPTRILARLPGNQILQIESNTKVLGVPRLANVLDGLSIVHLSDLHFTGCITRDLFDFVVARTNALQADLITITGDIIDERPCLPWIGEVLGQLRAKYGVFCVFGNHDRRLRDIPLLIREVEQAGLTYLGGRWAEVQLPGQSLMLTGNELPWLGTTPDLAAYPENAAEGRPLRILLSHSPDQIAWARAADFDLMLAGHTHGGQIRLPLIGPIVGQSRYGLKYCSGVFYVPPTLLHVSRGVSQLQNLRLHCRPEMTKLVLRRG
jgi:predicted MPP superfamily phosphohydrolase